ncbi:polysaccharide ABC transporter ATP-binding protein [Dolichospermum sp. UHCC 0259]|uniref:ABC transporter ATP-binding protein n=1 Tax=Dolichospermum sp. UHCC 0259 TaxID=2590010 RepID=UPI001446FDE1|nr:polysaccharide ABC transporter ATP-binding protein [Dolichospermum sp. UHCC 0259]MTJ50309.1 ATP-binding cassette domain-containing protein [Dolichospermum sp. UHCC 0259]
MLNTEEQNLHDQTDNREVLVRVENVSKKFCRSLKKSLWYGVQDIGSEMMGIKYKHELRPDEFWSVKDVSFELRRGECLGLIGRNGAGKSTLLRILNGLIKPDRGRIEINGQVGGLIALGAGFNPILTGRENIYVNGSILGLSKAEIDAKFEEIIDFAEIGEFIDAPVQTYSSGMNVRLGFAVAAVLIQPDVLLLDEVLAVGDIGFTIKCLNAMRHLSNKSAVIFVSHSMQYVSSFCNRVMVMKEGQNLIESSIIGEAIDVYLSLFPVDENIAGSGEASIVSVWLRCQETGENGIHGVKVPHGTSLILEVEIQSHLESQLWMQIDTQGFVPVMASRILDEGNNPLFFSPGRHKIKLNLGKIEFNAGQYSIILGLVDPLRRVSLCRHQGIASFQVISDTVEWGYVVRHLVAESVGI